MASKDLLKKKKIEGRKERREEGREGKEGRKDEGREGKKGREEMTLFGFSIDWRERINNACQLHSSIA